MHALVQWWQDVTSDDLDEPVSPGIDGPAWMISLLAHASLILIFGTLFIDMPASEQPLTLVTAAEEVIEEKEVDIQHFRFSPDESEQTGSASVVGIDVPAPTAIQHDPIVSVRTELVPVEIAKYEAPVLSDVSAATTVSDKVMMKGNAGVGAVGAVGAVDRITQEIILSLERRPTIVVWLFDQSWSMLPQRQAVNERLARVYKELGVSDIVARSQKQKPLLSSVIAFGKNVNVLTPELTDDIDLIQRTVAGIENDESGVEMTFTAITKAVETYKVHHQYDRRNIMLVVFTDEVGDDEDKLDSTIAACRMHGAPVYVVGAPAPFGRRNIEFKYVDPDPNFDQSVQWLPVRSGPESFLPEMVNMGFIGFERRDADLYRMDSGFGPYCLTRLCYETGGIFFSVHAARPESAEGFVPSASTPAMSARLNYFFDPSIMRSYMPDYLPVNEYVKKISANKAKQQLVRTAEMSMVMPMDRPQLVFDRNPDNEAALKRTLDEAQKKAAILEPELNMLYSTLKQGEADRPKITEPRWQANFDLAMARILAAKVRTEGYNFMLARAKGGLKYDNPKTNLLELQASDDVTWSSQHKKMADQARELLQRVAHDHSGTPWAKLAEEELQHPIGWRWVARYIPPPPAPAVAKANPKATPTPPPPNNARPKAPPRPMNAQPKPVRQNIKL